MLWLICFYLLFHSTLNTLGEVLGFADRCTLVMELLEVVIVEVDVEVEEEV